MVTVRDGIKLGLGLLFFKWIIGFIGVVSVLGIGLCVATNQEAEKQALATKKAQKQNLVKVRRTKAKLKASISYPKGCIMREGPGTKHPRVGYVRAGAMLSVLSQQGHWRQVSDEKQQQGWCGCTPD